MEALIVILPLVITVGNCGLSCYYYNRANNRIAVLERYLASLNLPLSYNPVPPPASAPPDSPGYGYQYYPEGPRII